MHLLQLDPVSSSLSWHFVVRTPFPADSQGIRAGNFLYCSGQIGLDPKVRVSLTLYFQHLSALLQTGEFVTQEIKGQTEQVLKNLKAVITAGGSTMDLVLKVRPCNSWLVLTLAIVCAHRPLCCSRQVHPILACSPCLFRVCAEHERLQHGQRHLRAVFPDQSAGSRCLR